MSPETLRLCRELLDQVQLSGADPQFEAKAARIVSAKRELDEALSVPEAEAD